MVLVAAYSLQISPRDEADVAAELGALEAADPKALGRLLRVIRDIVDRGDEARDENVHLGKTTPGLHKVRVGALVAFYAYGRDNGFYLLGTGRRDAQRALEALAAARIVNVPPEV